MLVTKCPIFECSVPLSQQDKTGCQIVPFFPMVPFIQRSHRILHYPVHKWYLAGNHMFAIRMYTTLWRSDYTVSHGSVFIATPYIRYAELLCGIQMHTRTKTYITHSIFYEHQTVTLYITKCTVFNNVYKYTNKLNKSHISLFPLQH